MIIYMVWRTKAALVMTSERHKKILHKRGWMTEEDVVEIVRQQVNLVGQERFARIANVSQQYVSEVVRGTRHPGPAILKALGIEKKWAYIPKYSE